MSDPPGKETETTEGARSAAEEITSGRRGVTTSSEDGGDVAIVFEQKTIARVRSDPKGAVVQYFDRQGWRFTRDLDFARAWIKRRVRGERQTARVREARKADQEQLP